MDEIKTLNSLGLTLPTPAYFAGMIIFSIIGMAAYYYGKKASLRNPKWIGVALMFYPYAVSETWVLYVVGCVLCVGLYIYRR